MTYLEARSAEYQIRMNDAAKSYLKLGSKYPKHSRAQTALIQAEKLSIAENDFKTAADAASRLAERSSSPQKRLGHYSRAIEYLSKAKSPKAALAIAKRRLKSSRTTAERFTSEIMASKMLYQIGREQEAIDDMTIVTRKLSRSKRELSKAEYGRVAGEAHFFLGMESRRKFNDFSITERRGGLAKNIRQKTRYFNDLSEDFDKAAKAGDPRWSARARFELAVAAEALSDEIASASSSEAGKTTTISLKRFEQSVKRLKKTAKKYHSTNLLVAKKNPAAFRNNPWVKKSSLRLSGEERSKFAIDYREEIPSALNVDLPSEWSL